MICVLQPVLALFRRISLLEIQRMHPTQLKCEGFELNFLSRRRK